MRRCTALLCGAGLFCVLSVQRAAPQEALIYEPSAAWEHPELAAPSADDVLFAAPRTRHYANRSFYYTGLSRSGYSWVIQLFNWHYAWFDGWGIAIVVGGFDGMRFVYEGKIGQRDLTEAPGAFSIRFGGNLMESDGRTARIVLAIDDFRCDLTLHSVLPAWIPGDGYAKVVGREDLYLRKAVPVPLAETRGTLEIGTTAISADGWAYGDRSLIVAPLGSIDSSGSAFRVFSETAGDGGRAWGLAMLDYASIGGREGARVPMLLLTHGSEWVLTSKDYQLTYEDLVPDPATAVAHPRRIHLSARGGGCSLEGDFLVDRFVHTSDVVDHFPGLLRGLVSAFIQRPVIFRSIGHFVGTVVGPDGSIERLRLAGQGDYFTVR